MLTPKCALTLKLFRTLSYFNFSTYLVCLFTFQKVNSLFHHLSKTLANLMCAKPKVVLGRLKAKSLVWRDLGVPNATRQGERSVLLKSLNALQGEGIGDN